MKKLMFFFLLSIQSFAIQGFKQDPKAQTTKISGPVDSFKLEDGEIKVVIAEHPTRYRCPADSKLQSQLEVALKTKKIYTWTVDAYNRKVYQIK